MARPAELYRFATVGLAAYGVTTVTYYLLNLTVLWRFPVLALAAATLLSTAFSYVLSRRWSFADRRRGRRGREAALFTAVNAVAWTLGLVPEFLARHLLHLEVPYVSHFAQQTADLVAGLVLGTAAGTAFRWWGYRRWVFPGGVSSGNPDRPQATDVPRTTVRSTALFPPARTVPAAAVRPDRRADRRTARRAS